MEAEEAPQRHNQRSEATISTQQAGGAQDAPWEQREERAAAEACRKHEEREEAASRKEAHPAAMTPRLPKVRMSAKAPLVSALVVENCLNKDGSSEDDSTKTRISTSI